MASFLFEKFFGFVGVSPDGGHLLDQLGDSAITVGITQSMECANRFFLGFGPGRVWRLCDENLDEVIGGNVLQRHSLFHVWGF